MAALHRPALPLPRKLGTPFDKIRSGRLALCAALGLMVGAALLQVNQFSRVASTGYEINDLNRQRAAKQAENHGIEADVARLSSLARVDIEARVRLHMEPAQQKLYIDVNQPVPMRETLPTRFLPTERSVTEAAPRAAHTPFWKRLFKRLPFF
jgi:hypothetical protein